MKTNDSFEAVKQGMELATEISLIQKKVAEYLNKHLDSNGSLLIFMVENSLSKTVSDAMKKVVREMAKEHPDLADEMRKKGLREETISDILKEENSEQEDVDFQPVK